MPINYIIEKKSFSDFDRALNEKVIVQDGKFVKANNKFVWLHNNYFCSNTLYTMMNNIFL